LDGTRDQTVAAARPPPPHRIEAARLIEHVDPSAEIAQTLSEAYRSIGPDLDLATASPWLDEVVKINRIYAENMEIEPLEIISTQSHGIVLTKESAIVERKPRTWRAIHLWRFEAGRCTLFEVYNRTLIVAPHGLTPEL
jgi:hypothetical protein